MTEQQALTRCVEAFERIATALETMARQQGEFLATMPAEEPAAEFTARVGEPSVLHCWAPITGEAGQQCFHCAQCGAIATKWDIEKVVHGRLCPQFLANEQQPPDPSAPTHPYDATCACLACWTERRKAKRE